MGWLHEAPALYNTHDQKIIFTLFGPFFVAQMRHTGSRLERNLHNLEDKKSPGRPHVRLKAGTERAQEGSAAHTLNLALPRCEIAAVGGRLRLPGKARPSGLTNKNRQAPPKRRGAVSSAPRLANALNRCTSQKAAIANMANDGEPTSPKLRPALRRFVRAARPAAAPAAPPARLAPARRLLWPRA